MAQAPKIYLETTMFNYYFDKDRDAHADTVALFEECAAGRLEPFSSKYVTDELNDASEGKRKKMLALIEKYNIHVLERSEEVNNLADKYIDEGALPKSSLKDAQHIAAAAVGEIDMIVSLNFSHIVKERTRELTGIVNNRYGYNAVQIFSPKEVLNEILLFIKEET